MKIRYPLNYEGILDWQIEYQLLKVFILWDKIREFSQISHFVWPYTCGPLRIPSKRVKGSRNRPGVSQRVPGDLGSQISMTFGTWRWWGRQPNAPAAFTSRKCSWYSFSLEAESTPGPWYGRKEYVTVTPPGIDPGSVRLVTQRLNHYATPRIPCNLYLMRSNRERLQIWMLCT